jgi:mannose-1-phosphate guanylyltransferase/mannose-6-phosphate isomerase
VEKPDAARAAEYVSSGEYFWNSGMFLFRASSWLEELGSQAPAILETATSAYRNASHDLDFVRLDHAPFSECPADSIDYAVMEHTERAVMVALEASWSDIGSWASLWEVSAQDDHHNSVTGDVVLQATEGCLVRAETRLVAGLGLENLVIVETADAVLVAAKERIQEVKNLVDRLKSDGRREATEHRKVYRPWGSYDSVDVGGRFQVKRISVDPGERLSLQMHHHRAEHWVVVRGTARVTCGDRVMLLTEDQSTYIPVGEKHRLENPGQIPLELIEIQSGSYLGEDDIVRFDDAYGRQQDDTDE